MSTPNKKLSEVLLELKQDYLLKLPNHLRTLRTLTASEDWSGLETEYHKLKGTGKTYGYPEISAVCERLEIYAHQKDTQIIGLFQQAVELLERMRRTYAEGKSFDMTTDATVKAIMNLRKSP